MIETQMRSTQLHRARVQSQVIEASMVRLSASLSAGGNAELLGALKPLARQFGQYVNVLNEACTAEESGGIASSIPAGPLS